MNKRKMFKLKNVIAKFMAFIMLITCINLIIEFSEEQIVYANDYEYHWSSNYLQNLVNKDIMRGDQYGNLDPDRNITRAEFTSMINRALGFTTRDEKNAFGDVLSVDWFEDCVNIAYNQGYFLGRENGVAAPNEPLKREEAVTMICRALGIEGEAGENFGFIDSRDFNSWSNDYINVFAEKRYVVGYEDKTFRPQNSITRGEVAKVLTDVVGTIYNTQGIKTLGYVQGNVTISETGVSLIDGTVTGDLYITEGVDLGFTSLRNINVVGSLIITGAGESNVGESSITLDDCNINKVTINVPFEKTLTLKTSGSTIVNSTRVISDAYLEELTDGDGGFMYIEIEGAPETHLSLSGYFDEVKMLAPNNTMALDRGYIGIITVDEKAVDAEVFIEANTHVDNIYIDVSCDITGSGTLSYALVNAAGVTISMLPDKIDIRPGITSKVDGSNMSSTQAEVSSLTPAFASGYPKVTDIIAKSANVLFKTNKPGKVYWIITTEAQNLPTSSEVLSPPADKTLYFRSGNSVIGEGVELTTKLSSLSNYGTYTISAVFVDLKDQRSSIVNRTFTTLDDVVPNFVSGYPVASNTTGSAVDISVMLDKPSCELYWAVYDTKSVVPTIEKLVAQDLPGTITYGTNTITTENIAVTFNVSGLEQKTGYTMYLVAYDGRNYSKLTTYAFNTGDTTPPYMNDNYPKITKTTTSAVTVAANSNEKGKIYYVAVLKGSDYPVSTTYGVAAPDINSLEGKEALKAGLNAFKSGSSSANADTDVSLNISGLAAETSYDVYILIEDEALNMSEVYMIEIRTTDNVAPSATLTYDVGESERPTATSTFVIEFTEVALTTAISPNMSLLDIWSSTDLRSQLATNFKLYSLSPKREEVVINFDYVTVEEINEKTVVTFKPGSLPLISSGQYEFELSKIADLSGNAIKDKTTLPEFTTEASSVLFSQIDIAAGQTPQMGFSILPISTEASDDVYCDIVITPSNNLKIKVYEKNGSAYIPVTGTNGISMLKDDPQTLRYLIDKQANNQDYQFTTFNQLTSKEYAFEIVELNGHDGVTDWNETVTLGLQMYAGSYGNLSAIASNPSGNLDTLINSAVVARVSYPEDFEISYTFTDINIPLFLTGFPKFDVFEGTNSDDDYIEISNGDTYLFGDIQTDRAAEMYWLVVPSARELTNVTGLGIVSGSYNSITGSQTGMIETVDSGIPAELEIYNLTAETEYDLFYTLKGNPPEYSAIYKYTFTTGVTTPPVIELANLASKGEEMVTINVRVDSTSTVYYKVFNKGDVVVEGENVPSSEDILDTDAPGNQPVTTGSFEVVADIRSQVNVTGLAPGRYYTICLVAVKPIDVLSKEVVFIDYVTPIDTIPPEVSITNTFDDVEVSTFSKYDGAITVTFTESIYYVEGNADSLNLLTEEVFVNKLSSSAEILEPTINAATGKYQYISKNEFFTNPDYEMIDICILGVNTDSDGGVISFQLAYKGISNGAEIYIDAQLGDEFGIAGQLTIQFAENREDQYLSYWFAEFNSVN